MPAIYVELPRQVLKAIADSDTPCAARQAAVEQAAELLRSSESYWPIAQRQSRGSRLKWRTSGTGCAARLFNPASYASYVERSGGRRDGPRRSRAPRPALRMIRARKYRRLLLVAAREGSPIGAAEEDRRIRRQRRQVLKTLYTRTVDDDVRGQLVDAARAGSRREFYAAHRRLERTRARSIGRQRLLRFGRTPRLSRQERRR